MKYPDGQEVKLGDKVRLCNDEVGIVVASMDTDEYTEENPKEQWGYLKKGVMIDSPKYGLFHYPESDEDLELISRAPPSE
jgi:hypothetical protein